MLTAEQIVTIIGPVARPVAGSAMRSRQDNIIQGTVDALETFAPAFKLDLTGNLCRFIGQIAVECDYFRTTKEYASGSAYEGRADLGNTQAGDGTRFRGRGLIQLTGRANVTKFNVWAHATLSDVIKDIPDFTKTPEELEKFPWAFFSAVWFWSKGNRTGKSLNEYAWYGNDEMVTRVINGGLTHYDRRLEMTSRAALMLLGFSVSSDGIRSFQSSKGLTADGLIGTKTRGALTVALQNRDMIAQSLAPLQSTAPSQSDHVAQEKAPTTGTPATTGTPSSAKSRKMMQ